MWGDFESSCVMQLRNRAKGCKTLVMKVRVIPF